MLNKVNSDKSFLGNTYKIEVGSITENSSIGTTGYEVGDPATGNVDGQMFGVLNLTETTLTYDFYTVDGNEVKLFDSLNVMKN